VFAEFIFPVLQPIDESRLPPISRAPGDKAPRGSTDYYSWLCGMVTWHLNDDRKSEASLYGVVAILPHYEIWRGLMAFQDERDAADEANAARIAAGGPRRTNVSAGDASEASEWERFEALTRKLVNTPKPKPEEDPAQ
jgi:hypothetical protein